MTIYDPDEVGTRLERALTIVGSERKRQLLLQEQRHPRPLEVARAALLAALDGLPDEHPEEFASPQPDDVQDDGTPVVVVRLDRNAAEYVLDAINVFDPADKHEQHVRLASELNALVGKR